MSAQPTALLRRTPLRLALLLCGVFSLASSCPARSQPPGRDWTQVQRLDLAPFDLLACPRFEETPNGAPVVYAEGGGAVNSTVRLRWQGSEWVPDWVLPFPCGLLWPVPTTTSTHTLMWKVNAYSPKDPNKADLVWADADQNGLVEPDTLAQVWDALSEYAAATTPVRRWAAASDYTNLRFFVKRQGSPTVEWEVPDQADMGLAIGAIDDTTALVIWGSAYFGFRWAIAGETWNPQGSVPDTYYNSERPRLRHRPSGGFWVGWATEEQTVVLRTFDKGTFTPYREFDSSVGDGAQYFSYEIDLSRDKREWPAVAWSRRSALTAEESICLAVPDTAGNYSTMAVPNSSGGGQVTVLQDVYGDVWLSWFAFHDASYWVHTYVKADALAPSIVRGADHVALSWKITEPAPQSHWTVLRSADGAPWDSLGSVIAGQDSILHWADAGAKPETAYRYQVRRDCVDAQFATLSPIASTPPLQRPGFALVADAGRSTSRRLQMSIRGAAAGPVRIQCFDVSGRLLAAGTVQDDVGPYREQAAAWDLGRSLGRGIYFLRAVDVSGVSSRTARALVLQ